MINLLIQLSESDKRVLIAFCLVFIIVLILFGYLVKLIKYLVKKQGDYVDNSMYDLLDANIIEDKKHFRKVSWEKNRRKFYFEVRLPFAIMVFSLLIIIFYQCFVGFDFAFIAKYNNELSLKLNWDNTTTMLLGFIPALENWPTIDKVPVFHFNEIEAWLTYIFDLGMIYGSIHFILCSISFLSRNIRTITVANEYFKKDIKALKEAKLAAKGIHTKKPSEDIKQMAKDEK